MKFKIEEKQYEGNPIWDWMSEEAKNLIGSKVILFNSPDGKDATITKLVNIDLNPTAYHHFMSDERAHYHSSGGINSRSRKFMYMASIDSNIPEAKAYATGLYSLYTSDFCHLLEKRRNLTIQLEDEIKKADIASKQLNILHEQIIEKTKECNGLLANKEIIKQQIEEIEKKIYYYAVVDKFKDDV